MRASRLLLTGIGVGAALTYALFYEPTMQREVAFDGTADRLRYWGAKNGVDPGVGRVKEGIGRTNGVDRVAHNGMRDRAVGDLELSEL